MTRLPVLTALTDTGFNEWERERIPALGAAHLALARADEGGNPTDDLRRIGFEDFTLLLDADIARTALGEAARGG
ncbi:hypothetical protein ADL00_29440 [Streptomyces sp. AS58]|uniref:hypothetical protein n=1 Tax=Streptomyces sp. AS58 TaxID=1519489 RepID=UPI0006AF0DC5|nr:hypothetical protein [Streptomyces sp. AS58]KOV54681.1 hypothetical protein ADL00_29440 [Streptomyces sp. AS58]